MLYVQKGPGQQTRHGPSVTNPTVSALGHPSSASQVEDSEDLDFSAQKSRLSAPQLQAQLSRLTDRIQLWPACPPWKLALPQVTETQEFTEHTSFAHLDARQLGVQY